MSVGYGHPDEQSSILQAYPRSISLIQKPEVGGSGSRLSSSSRVQGAIVYGGLQYKESWRAINIYICIWEDLLMLSHRFVILPA